VAFLQLRGRGTQDRVSITSGDVSLAAGANVITLSAPVATVSAGNSDIAAGGNVITLTAPVRLH
jgi:uncharacterized protein (DUF2345 family)